MRENSPPPELKPNQSAAVLALLGHPTIRDAAAAVGVAESTLYRWLTEPEFAVAYRTVQRDLWTHVMGNIQWATSEAVQALRDVMNSKASPEAARVSAARTVLDLARQNISLQDLEERIRAIEAVNEAREAKPKQNGGRR